MSEVYEMKSTSRQSAVIGNEIELSRNNVFRLILQTTIVNNSVNPDAGVEITFVYQRKSSKEQWENEVSKPLTTTKIGELRKLILSSSQTLRLYEYLRDFYAISASGGVRPGETSLVVGRKDEIILTDSEKTRIIKSLIEHDYTEDVWNAIANEKPDLATRLADAMIQAERKKGLEELEQTMNNDQPENWWQDFFERNIWIFGYGLRYQILKTVAPQPTLSAPNLQGRGGQRGDFLHRTEADVRFTVIVEIKRPQTPLLKGHQYRTNVPALGEDVVGGVSQLQTECRDWEVLLSRSEANQELLSKNKVFTVQPKGILIVGNTSQLDTVAKHNAFELFRRNLVNPEIITYDELLERARFIVGSNEAQEQQ